jgi:hypothetical protein
MIARTLFGLDFDYGLCSFLVHDRQPILKIVWYAHYPLASNFWGHHTAYSIHTNLLGSN